MSADRPPIALWGAVADALGEDEPEPRRTIRRAAALLGDTALRLAAAETARLLAAGGLVTLDGHRQRTPGGILLRVILEGCPPELRGQIFGRRRRFNLDILQSGEAYRRRFAAAVAAHRQDVTVHGR